MKKIILTLAIVGVIIATNSTAFGQESKKTDDACKNIVEIKDEKKLIKSRLDSDADYHKFKKEADEKIILNQNKIAELQAKKRNTSESANLEYDIKITTLKKKNDDLKVKINDSFSTKTCAWPEFKVDFDKEIEELEFAIKNIETDNKKLVVE